MTTDSLTWTKKNDYFILLEFSGLQLPRLSKVKEVSSGNTKENMFLHFSQIHWGALACASFFHLLVLLQIPIPPSCLLFLQLWLLWDSHGHIRSPNNPRGIAVSQYPQITSVEFLLLCKVAFMGLKNMNVSLVREPVMSLTIHSAINTSSVWKILFNVGNKVNIIVLVFKEFISRE